MAIVGERKRKKAKLPSVSKCDDYDTRWQVERDLEAVTRAKAVEADPDRMSLVKQLAKEKLEESKRKKDEAQALIDLGISE